MRSPIWLIFGFVAVCCTTQKTLDEQNMSVVTFEQLPKLVQDGFRNTKKYADVTMPINLLNFDSATTYVFEVKETGPFTDYFLVIDKTNKKEYIVPFDYPIPFVIYQRYMYSPMRHNIANTIASEKIEYKRYMLD
jgi:hypothetical protein